MGYSQERAKHVVKMAKIMKYVMHVLNAMVFFWYYGIPLLTIDGIRASDLGLSKIQSDDHKEHAAAFMKGVIFPLGHVGMGMKISRFGLVEKASSVGALVVYWSAQVMVGKVYECFEALGFR